MLKLRSDDVWSRLRAVAASPRRGTACVAVSFIGGGATTRLPLRRGDTLVTRCDEAAVRAGLVDPRELLRYLKRGVDVHAVANLHAKVFVLGGIAFVGSANLSSMSEHGLVEAVSESNEPRFVRACRRFVESLRGSVIDQFTVEALIPHYRPPKIHVPPSRTRKPRQAALSVVMLEPADLDDIDRSAVAASKRDAEGRIEDPDAFRLDYFRWSGKLPTRLRKGSMVLCCTEYGSRTTMVSPPARVVAIKRFRARRGARAIIYIAARKRFPERPLKSIMKRIPEAAMIRRVSVFRPITDRALARKLLALWPAVRPHDPR